MYDPVTLDQLRAFVTVVEEGSFSAAARKLRRVQSAVSTSMANLEQQLGVALWDRSYRVARLTESGRAVLGAARRVLREVDGLRTLTASMASGLEPQVSLCLDALFPLPALIEVCQLFARAFPTVDLRIDTQLMSAVSQRVLDGHATIGVVSPSGLLPGLERQALAPVSMVPLVSAAHPLAAYGGSIPERAFADHIQIVLSERSDIGVPDQAVLSARTWRVADLHTKHQLLRAGLGWGNLPEHIVRDDLRTRTLVRVRPAPWGEAEHTLYLSAVYRADARFGPAHRWMLAQLASACGRATTSVQPRPAPEPTRASEPREPSARARPSHPREPSARARASEPRPPRPRAGGAKRRR